MANPNPKPPARKRKKSISRHARGNKQKISNYSMDDARASLGLPADANHAQVLSNTLQYGPNPTLPRSPPKRVVKARLKQKQAENAVLSRDLDVAQHDLGVAQKDASHKAEKIKSLKQQVRDLSDALQVEKKKSRATVAKLIHDAEQIMCDACDIQSEAGKKMTAAELQLLSVKESGTRHMQAAQLKVSAEKQRSKLKLQEERRRSADYLDSG